MGRLIAFLLGGAALLHFGVHLVAPENLVSDYRGLWEQIDPDLYWYARVQTYGAGVVAGLGLLLLAVRGRD